MVNSLRVRVRRLWVCPPCKAAALTPRLASWRASRSEPCRVRQNTIVDPVALIKSTQVAIRRFLSTVQNRWSAAAMSGFISPTSWVTG